MSASGCRKTHKNSINPNGMVRSKIINDSTHFFFLRVNLTSRFYIAHISQDPNIIMTLHLQYNLSEYKITANINFHWLRNGGCAGTII
jgi:hypothetical protein